MIQTLLVADIGGTHSRIALFTAEHTGENSIPSLKLQEEFWLASGEFASFEALLEAAWHHADAHGIVWAEQSVSAAIFAVAGPVHDGIAKLPNLPWVVSPQAVQRALHIPSVFVINDFFAQGLASCIPHLVDTRMIHQGTPVLNAPRAVVGAGTGCGKALVLTSPEMRILPSEGGHGSFPFEGEEEFAFASFMASALGHWNLIGDAVVSGTGLVHLFAFHAHKWLPAPQVAALLPQHPVVLEWFARFYGRVCRNFILDTLSLDGLYITGGMAKHVPVLDHPAFLTELHHSPSQGDLLQSVPVWHMQSQQAGLFGAALYGAQALQKIGAF